ISLASSKLRRAIADAENRTSMSLPRTTGMVRSLRNCRLFGKNDRNGLHPVLREVEAARKGKSFTRSQRTPGCPQRIARDAAVLAGHLDLEWRQGRTTGAVVGGLAVDEQQRFYARSIDARRYARNAERRPARLARGKERHLPNESIAAGNPERGKGRADTG